MSIVVEDGTGVPDANSYASVEQLEKYASDRGITLPANVEALLFKAMDYIESQGLKFMGRRLFDHQELSWPREQHSIIMGVPTDIVKAQLVLAVAAASMELLPAVPGGSGFVTKRVVGPITIERKEVNAGINVDRSMTRVPQADALLKRYLESPMKGYLRVVRA